MSQLRLEGEVWEPLEEFPYYMVSNLGRVMNNDSEQLKIPSINQQGIANINFWDHGGQHRRSLAILVARVHLPPPPDPYKFDTPIHLDGDKSNCSAENLAWRPRWFARKYHSQFNRPHPWGFNAEVECVETGEVFPTLRMAAKKYGLLEEEIIMSTNNGTPCFPTWHTFQVSGL